MWPMLIALCVASRGLPAWLPLSVFLVGCFLMRSAGCAINDYADRHLDTGVARTQRRPLALKQIRAWEAVMVFIVLSLLAFSLVLFTNALTVILSVVGACLAGLYPFMKRITHLPQFVLGAAFAWAIPMSYAAVQGTVPPQAWWLYWAVLCWAVAYDTEYALVDKADDLKMGIKSTAILFGRWVNEMVVMMHALTLALLLAFAYYSDLWGLSIYIMAACSVVMIAVQYWQIKDHQPQSCFKAFLSNHWLGLVWFLGFASALMF